MAKTVVDLLSNTYFRNREQGSRINSLIENTISLLAPLTLWPTTQTTSGRLTGGAGKQPVRTNLNQLYLKVTQIISLNNLFKNHASLLTVKFLKFVITKQYAIHDYVTKLFNLKVMSLCYFESTHFSQ